ncbi:hypothetical protein [Chryseobacterium luteum]|uniref:Uncharacterized protein n=1 Tax=Chryseobacterium luteum TaxID=421531 RepID=A0A085ZWB9_9FLAO|nr:hypothetical protein [Chryseobacterium luteum]KFF08733.1 hypothetical protein IX38_04685 [Chryseobacterium luteum]
MQQKSFPNALKAKKTTKNHFDKTFNHFNISFNSFVEDVNFFVKAIKHYVEAFRRFEEAINQFEETINQFEDAIKYNLLHFTTLQTFANLENMQILSTVTSKKQLKPNILLKN